MCNRAATLKRAFAAWPLLLLATQHLDCSSAPTQRGVRIRDETLKQFKAGVTTESWLLAVLGPPTSS